METAVQEAVGALDMTMAAGEAKQWAARDAAATTDAQSVAVLMGVMNGGEFLSEQLDSIAAQTHPHWTVWVSDDGSTDGTQEMVREFARRWGEDRVSLVRGPAKGFAANFLSLACRPEIEADYFAFADQDDVWEPDKFARAVAWLRTIPADTPALYCGRTLYVAKDGAEIGPSPVFTRTPCFANALIQCLAGGNTMVFNEAARGLLRRVGADTRIVSHDWWMYLLVSGCGGRICYDSHPTVRYRQHGGNLIGSKAGVRARLRRWWEVLHGGLADLTETNVRALEKATPFLTKDNQQIFQRFSQARKRSMVPRCVGILRSGVHRQTAGGNFGFAMATLLGVI